MMDSEFHPELPPDAMARFMPMMGSSPGGGSGSSTPPWGMIGSGSRIGPQEISMLSQLLGSRGQNPLEEMLMKLFGGVYANRP